MSVDVYIASLVSFATNGEDEDTQREIYRTSGLLRAEVERLREERDTLRAEVRNACDWIEVQDGEPMVAVAALRRALAASGGQA